MSAGLSRRPLGATDTAAVDRKRTKGLRADDPSRSRRRPNYRRLIVASPRLNTGNRKGFRNDGALSCPPPSGHRVKCIEAKIKRTVIPRRYSPDSLWTSGPSVRVPLVRTDRLTGTLFVCRQTPPVVDTVSREHYADVSEFFFWFLMVFIVTPSARILGFLRDE